MEESNPIPGKPSDKVMDHIFFSMLPSKPEPENSFFYAFLIQKRLLRSFSLITAIILEYPSTMSFFTVFVINFSYNYMYL